LGWRNDAQKSYGHPSDNPKPRILLAGVDARPARVARSTRLKPVEPSGKPKKTAEERADRRLKLGNTPNRKMGVRDVPELPAGTPDQLLKQVCSEGYKIGFLVLEHMRRSVAKTAASAKHKTRLRLAEFYVEAYVSTTKAQVMQTAARMSFLFMPGGCLMDIISRVWDEIFPSLRFYNHAMREWCATMQSCVRLLKEARKKREKEDRLEEVEKYLSRKPRLLISDMGKKNWKTKEERRTKRMGEPDPDVESEENGLNGEFTGKDGPRLGTGLASARTQAGNPDVATQPGTPRTFVDSEDEFEEQALLAPAVAVAQDPPRPPLVPPLDLVVPIDGPPREVVAPQAQVQPRRTNRRPRQRAGGQDGVVDAQNAETVVLEVVPPPIEAEIGLPDVSPQAEPAPTARVSFEAPPSEGPNRLIEKKVKEFADKMEIQRRVRMIDDRIFVKRREPADKIVFNYVDHGRVALREAYLGTDFEYNGVYQEFLSTGNVTLHKMHVGIPIGILGVTVVCLILLQYFMFAFFAKALAEATLFVLVPMLCVYTFFLGFAARFLFKNRRRRVYAFAGTRHTIPCVVWCGSTEDEFEHDSKYEKYWKRDCVLHYVELILDRQVSERVDNRPVLQRETDPKANGLFYVMSHKSLRIVDGLPRPVCIDSQMVIELEHAESFHLPVASNWDSVYSSVTKLSRFPTSNTEPGAPVYSNVNAVAYAYHMFQHHRFRMQDIAEPENGPPG